MTAPMMNELLAANQPVVVDDTNIINVWNDNLEESFREISEIVQTHPYVAMDTEFPGAHLPSCSARNRRRDAESARCMLAGASGGVSALS